MKTKILSIPRKAFAASLAAGLAAAGVLLCGVGTQAQPTISSISLPNSVNNPSPTGVGTYQFEGALPPNTNYLSFQVSSATGVTALTVTLTAFPLPIVTTYATGALGAGTITTYTPTSGLGGATAGSLSETVTLGLAPDTLYSATISATDAGGTTTSAVPTAAVTAAAPNGNGTTFDTLNPNYFTWEAEDFDYSGGQYIDVFSPGTATTAATYLVDQYATLTSTVGIDVSAAPTVAGNGATASYRPAPESTGGSGDSARVQFAGSTDYEVGYNGGGDYANYTHHYPAGLYNIYSRMADGAGSAQNSIQFSLVTNGYGTSNQTLMPVGESSIHENGAGTWSTYNWSEAIDAKGFPSAWAPVGDQETMRVTIVNGNNNIGYYMLVPAVPALTPNNPVVFPGASVALSIDVYDVYALATNKFQWQTDGGTHGVTWTSMSGATNNSISVTNTATGNFQYQVAVTISSNSIPITVTSAPVTINMVAPIAPSVASQIQPSSPISALTGTATSLSAVFNGLPLTYQWLVSSNLGVTFTPVVGQTNTSLLILNLTAFTNEYELQATNSLGVATTTPVTLTTTLAPPTPPLQFAGDIIAELRSTDLVTSAKTWTNRSGSPFSVGNFKDAASSTLTVSNYNINAGAPIWGAYAVNSLYVSTGAQALTSAALSPNEINTNMPMTMEAWIYPTAISAQSPIMSYGANGGSAAPAEQRDFGYGPAGYEAFTADYQIGSSDQGWNTLTANTWHYVAVTWDGIGALTTYQDGVLNKTSAGPLNTFQTLVTVGQATASGNFTGFIASARLESGVLTANQVATNFAAGLLAPVPIEINAVTASPSPVVTTTYSATLNASFTTNIGGLTYTYQWLWDGGSGGTNWTNIVGATSASYVLNSTGLPLGTYEYEVELTNTLDSIGLTSDPITISVVAATGPLLATNPGTNTVYVNQLGVFTGSFTGPIPINLQWQVSSDAVNWASTGASTTNNGLTATGSLSVSGTVPLTTNYYRLQAINPYGTNYTTAGELIVLPAPFLPVQVAGDLVVNLMEQNLTTNSAVWTNQAGNQYNVGNFMSGTATITVTNAAPLWNGLPVTALYVSSGATALTSTGLSPAEMNVAGPMTMELWINDIALVAQAPIMSYGANGGSGGPDEQRDFGYATLANGYTAFTADYGNSDQNWSVTGSSAGVWHYLVCTWDGTAVRTYQDGVFNKSTPGPLNTFQTPVTVGKATASGNFNGFIASARMESGVLTPSQITYNFGAGIFGFSPPSLSPLSTYNGLSNAITLGQTATLGVVAVTNAQTPMTYQWYADNGTQGATWTAIPGATGLTYLYTTTNISAYGFEVAATNVAYSIGGVSLPTIVNVVASAPVALVSDITPTGTTTTNVTVVTTFSAAFSGSPVVYYQWQQSPNGTTWTSVTGANTTNLTVQPEVTGTTYYRLQATNSVNTLYSSAAELITTAAPALPGITLATAGDLIVNLQNKDLVAGATVWTNQTTNVNSVGFFYAIGGGKLNVLSSSALAFDDYNLNVLNVSGTAANALQSALLSPNEINTNGPMTMEAWVYPTSVSGQSPVMSYGANGGSTGPAEQRDLGYGPANYEAFTADYQIGTSDQGWTTLTANTWHYLVVTWNGTNGTPALITYQDAVLNATSAGPLNTFQTPVTVGTATASGNFAGYIGAARLESGVLTPAQITNNFQAGLFGTVSASLLPLPSQGPPGLGATVSGGKLTLTWAAPAVLVQSTNVYGPWTPVSGATSPFVITPSPGVQDMFFTLSGP